MSAEQDVPTSTEEARSATSSMDGASATPVATATTEVRRGGLADLSRLKLATAAEATVSRKVLMTVPCRKPGRQEWIRVRSGDEWKLSTNTLVSREENKVYLVEPELWPQVVGDLVPTQLVTVINRQGVVSLWPLRLPGSDGRSCDWHTSALEASLLAEQRWIKVTSNMALSAYEVHEALGTLSEPEWPDATFEQLIKLAFKDAFIETEEHPLLLRLQGKV